MDRIGGSSRVRDELKAALTEGRNVTAKIRWVTRSNREGKDRWIHCTPLMGGNGQIGVWMIVVVDDEQTGGSIRVKRAPPVENMPPNRAAMRDHQERRHLLRHENQDFTRNLSPSLSERLVPR